MVAGRGNADRYGVEPGSEYPCIIRPNMATIQVGREWSGMSMKPLTFGWKPL